MSTPAASRFRIFGLESVAVLLAFLGAAFLLYEPVMEGHFVSDDHLVIVANPYVQELSLENLAAILDPTAPPVGYAMNYSPVHLVLHAVEVELFGRDMRGYHAVNVAVHALTAWLLAWLLIGSRVHPWVAAGAGLFFLVHPANVEAVAMVFQLKTTLAAALALGAILAIWRHPLLATLAFGLALLTKFSALFALPVVGVLFWVRSADAGRPLPHWGWLAAWTLVLVAVAIPEFGAFRRSGHGIEQDLLVHGRTIVAVAARYLVMAATSIGIGAFQQPSPALSWTDPWFLAGCVALPLLAWRTVATLARREEEAAWWILAAAAFAPISQLFPFIYPVADRYLYTILPGLIGGGLLAARPLGPRVEAWLRARFPARATTRPLAPLAATALLLAVSLVFAPRTWAHTHVYRDARALAENAVANYPDGFQAWLGRAAAAAAQRDVAGTVEALEALDERGFTSFTLLQSTLAPVRGDPRLESVVKRLARAEAERYAAIEEPFPLELYGYAQVLLELGRYDDAVEAMRRAVAWGGPRQAEFRRALEELRREIRRRDRGASTRGAGEPGSIGP